LWREQALKKISLALTLWSVNANGEIPVIISMREWQSKNRKESNWEGSRQVRAYSILSLIYLKVKVHSEILLKPLQLIVSLDREAPGLSHSQL
jgi:hypothetical protein